MKDKQIFILLFVYATISALTIFFFDGTGDAGDSIYHYLFAKYAPVHRELYFDHWAKPVFVLLASPFAQFGFTGVKIFNTIVSLLTIYFTFKIAQRLYLANSILSAVILFFSPLYFSLTFSGLTEHLFALILSIGLYAHLVNRSVLACLVISFLPFIRSEGLIILGVFGLYFLMKRDWKLVPLLLFGHVVYSISGFFVFNDLFWIFNKIPYARLSSTYGSGELFHFVTQLFYVIGVPIYILFWVGVIVILWKSIKKKMSFEVQTLVFLGFFSFFIAHSIFWYLGIFNSMGLKRVLIGVSPLISFISLIGFNFLTEEIFQKNVIPKSILKGLFIGFILIFPFTSNPAAIDPERDLKLTKDQHLAIKIVALINQNRNPNQCLIYGHPYLTEALNIDPFDQNKRLALSMDNISHAKTGDIVIWDNWFSVVENGVTKEFLDKNTDLTAQYKLSDWDKGHEILFSVYIKN